MIIDSIRGAPVEIGPDFVTVIDSLCSCHAALYYTTEEKHFRSLRHKPVDLVLEGH